MKLKRFLLRYYPPGIILEYETKGDMKSKDIDLLDLSVECVTQQRAPNFLHLGSVFLSASAARCCATARPALLSHISLVIYCSCHEP